MSSNMENFGATEDRLVVGSSDARNDITTVLNMHGLNEHPKIIKEEYKIRLDGGREISQIAVTDEGVKVLIEKIQEPDGSMHIQSISPVD